VKLVHLIGFIIKKFVTLMHGHMNLKFSNQIHALNLKLKPIGIWVVRCNRPVNSSI